MLLSVIVISKNEEKNIARCLESIFDNIVNIKFETIIVDSNSSDKTIEIAKRYPCKILKIQSNIYTAALGRQVGVDESKGKYLLFLDGDMELCPHWIDEGLNFLNKSSDNTLGVIGIRKDIIYKKAEINKILTNVYNINKIKKASHFGGAFMAKSSCLKEIGGYTISLPSNEEPELHSRVLKQGYEVYEIPKMMIIHHTPYLSVKNKLVSLFGIRNTGIAQGLKYSIANSTATFYCRRLKKFIIPIISDYLTIIMLLTFFLFARNSILNTYLLIGCFLLQVMAFVFSGGVKRYILNKFFIVPFTLGLIKKNEHIQYRVIDETSSNVQH